MIVMMMMMMLTDDEAIIMTVMMITTMMMRLTMITMTMAMVIYLRINKSAYKLTDCVLDTIHSTDQ